MDGFGMIFRALGIEPDTFTNAIREIQQMAAGIYRHSQATDQRLERIERKLDLILGDPELNVKRAEKLLSAPNNHCSKHNVIWEAGQGCGLCADEKIL